MSLLMLWDEQKPGGDMRPLMWLNNQRGTGRALARERL